jgi:hypothetical protein
MGGSPAGVRRGGLTAPHRKNQNFTKFYTGSRTLMGYLERPKHRKKKTVPLCLSLNSINTTSLLFLVFIAHICFLEVIVSNAG